MEVSHGIKMLRMDAGGGLICAVRLDEFWYEIWRAYPGVASSYVRKARASTVQEAIDIGEFTVESITTTQVGQSDQKRESLFLKPVPRGPRRRSEIARDTDRIPF